jgi:hypothetical protein
MMPLRMSLAGRFRIRRRSVSGRLGRDRPPHQLERHQPRGIHIHADDIGAGGQRLIDLAHQLGLPATA